MTKSMLFKPHVLVFAVLCLMFVFSQNSENVKSDYSRRQLTGSSSSSEEASHSSSHSSSEEAEGGGDSSHSSSESASAEGGGDSSHSSSHSSSEEASAEGGGDSSSSEEAAGGGDSSHSSSEEGGGDASAGGGDAGGGGDSGAGDINEGENAFSMAMAVIIAREFIEAVCIMGAVRTGIREIEATERKKEALLKSSTWWCFGSGGLALGCVLVIGIILAAVSGEVDYKTQEILEGISKLIAFVFVTKIALKIPKWAGLYPQKKKEVFNEIIDNEFQFFFWQVGWNIFREMLEIGLFMIPYALAGKMTAFPLSCLIGISICAGCCGFYMLSAFMSSERNAVIIMCSITVLLAIGLLSTGMHEFEEVGGLTPRTYDLGDAMTHHKLPFSIIRVFGYSSSPTVLELVSWWIGAVLQVVLHYIAATKVIDDQSIEDIAEGKGDVEMAKSGEKSPFAVAQN